MSNDIKVKELMAKVEEKRKSLGTKKRVNLKTNGKFSYDSTNFINLHVENNPDNFAKALAFLLQRKGYHQEACRRLDLPIDTFKWGDYFLEEWEEDFKARIQAIQWDTRKKELDQAEKNLENLLSTEGKTAAALEEIAGILN